jgi:hypothetical protein
MRVDLPVPDMPVNIGLLTKGFARMSKSLDKNEKLLHLEVHEKQTKHRRFRAVPTSSLPEL